MPSGTTQTTLFITAKKHKRKHEEVEPDLPYISDATTSKFLCKHIPMPQKSIFMGMDSPTDPVKWAQAIVSPTAVNITFLKSK